MANESGPTSDGYHSDNEMWLCPKEYQFARVRQISTPRVNTPDHFAVGGLFHAARARWFTLRFPKLTDMGVVANLREAMREEAEGQKLPVSVDAQKRALELMYAYADYWGHQPLPTVIAAEYFVGPVPVFPGSKLVRTARLDDVSRYVVGGNGLWLGESKTTSKDIMQVVSYYEQHPQPMLQKLLWKLAPQGEKLHGPVEGVMLDVVQKPYSGKKPKFERIPLLISDRQLDEFARVYENLLRQKMKVDWNSKVPRNYACCTRAVAGNQVNCQFKELCRFGRSAATKYTVGGLPMSTWKPLSNQKVAPWE